MRIAIVGSGPGGLAAAMLLGHQGHDVHIYEKEPIVGGRNAKIQQDGFTHDLGPTFFMYPQFLEEIFSQCGENLHDCVSLKMLDTMYRLTFPSDKILDLTSDPVEMRTRIDAVFPGESKGYDEYCKREHNRLEKFIPCFRRPYGSLGDFLYPTSLALLGHLDIGKSVYDVLSRYFHDDELKLAFSFQSKYLGMSPLICPGAFTMLAYLEHRYGIWHVEGGLATLASAMLKVAQKKNVHIFYNTPVSQVLVREGSAYGLTFLNGEQEVYDKIILNVDFSHAMHTLFDPQDIKKWSPDVLEQKKYSCSTFMIYLGIDTVYQNEPHHHIVFSENYLDNVDDITHERPSLEDFSVYIRNASITDTTLAPKGSSELYILVPVSNTRSHVDWNVSKADFRNKVIDMIKKRTNMKDIDMHIISEIIITPDDWQEKGVHYGATFNLAHSLDQMLYFRPHNKFECVDNVYLVGGGTHPGSGLPTIYASAMIVADMIGSL